MKQVLITGGTGLVGRKLTKHLQEAGYKVAFLSRNAEARYKDVRVYQWNVKEGTIEEGALLTSDYIIHLAGAGVMDERWNDNRKQVILDSRVKSGELILNELKRLNHLPQAYISASGIGYYGDCGDEWVDENSSLGDTFLAEVCRQWEQPTQAIHDIGIRTAILRVGLVLSARGGALSELEKPLKFGLGAYLGNGQQWYSWIHIDDLCEMFVKALGDDKMQGAYNAVAPNPARNKQVVKKVGEAMDQWILMAPTPAFVLKLMLGEMSAVVLESTRVKSDKIEEAGFRFKYPELLPALKHLYKQKGG